MAISLLSLVGSCQQPASTRAPAVQARLGTSAAPEDSIQATQEDDDDDADKVDAAQGDAVVLISNGGAHAREAGAAPKPGGFDLDALQKKVVGKATSRKTAVPQPTAKKSGKEVKKGKQARTGSAC
jgi:hypothetical protein